MQVCMCFLSGGQTRVRQLSLYVIVGVCVSVFGDISVIGSVHVAHVVSVCMLS